VKEKSVEAKRLRLVETPAERRGRLAAEEPGELAFSDQFSAVEAMQARLRQATAGTSPDRAKQKDIAAQGEMSTSTVGNMASGKTHYPRFSTMFGLAAALGGEWIYRPGKARKP
jgi:hypothetical protein